MAQLARAGNGPPAGNNEKSGLNGEELKRSKQGPRKRVSQACDKCRSRKDKCDGKKPVSNFSIIKSLSQVAADNRRYGIWPNAGARKLALMRRTALSAIIRRGERSDVIYIVRLNLGH